MPSPVAGGSDLGGVIPHRCNFCGQIEIVCSGPAVEIHFNLSYEEVLVRARRGCRLIRWCLVEFGHRRMHAPSLHLYISTDSQNISFMDFEWSEDKTPIMSGTLYIFATDSRSFILSS
jgi:hypothetical protein